MEIKINSKNMDKVLQLKAAVDYNLAKATRDRDEKINRFQRSYLYYMCKQPERHGAQISGYIEPVVRRAVEAIKPSLMNVFTENEKYAVRFRPTALTPPQVAEQIDNVINDIFLNKNDGYNILDRAITETLVTGDSFFKVYLEVDEVEEDPFELDGMGAEELAMILQEWPNTDGDDVEERDGLMYGTITPKRIENNIRVELIDFKDMIVMGSYEDIADARYVCHRIGKTVGELVAEGYDREKLVPITLNEAVYSYLSTEKLVNQGVYADTDKTQMGDDNERFIYTYEHYIYSSIFDRKGRSRLYQVFATETQILKITEVDFIPFAHGVVERIPGSFWGVSLYDKFYREQDLLTDLERAVIDNAQYNAYDRYLVIKGQYDRQSLLNNRPGAVIECADPASVRIFEKSQMPPTASESIARISANLERNIISSVGVDVTGANVSATAAAITANSADMKDKVMAKVFAYTAIRPLFKCIYNLIRAIEGASNLPKVVDFQVDVNTSNDEGILANQLVQLATLFAQMPEGSVNKQEMAKAITGISDEEVIKYFPLPPQPTEEDMLKMQEQEAEAKDVAMKQKALLEAQVNLTVAQVATEEVKAQEMILNGEAEREREKEDSVRKFQALGLKEVELKAEIATGDSFAVGQYGGIAQ